MWGYLMLRCDTHKVRILTSLEHVHHPWVHRQTHMLPDRPPRHSVCMPLEQLAVGGAFCTKVPYNIDNGGHQTPRREEWGLWDIHKHCPPFFSFHSSLSLVSLLSSYGSFCFAAYFSTPQKLRIGVYKCVCVIQLDAKCEGLLQLTDKKKHTRAYQSVLRCNLFLFIYLF